MNPATPQEILAVSGVTVRFGGIVALNDISFVVNRGETVGLIGPNGAGKTTLLEVVAGARRPQAGEVALAERVITRASVVARARLGIARTFQQLSLFEGMTVREHVMLGYLAARASDRGARRVLASRARVAKEIAQDRSPLGPEALMERLGLRDVADELAADQSVGIVRMVDLARALASRPQVLLLDEPVSGLSEPEAAQVARMLLDLRADHDLSMLVIEHDLEFARMVADRMLALDFGAVIVEGTADEVLGSQALRRAYFGDGSAAAVATSVDPG